MKKQQTINNLACQDTETNLLFAVLLSYQSLEAQVVLYVAG